MRHIREPEPAIAIGINGDRPGKCASRMIMPFANAYAPALPVAPFFSGFAFSALSGSP